MNAESIKHPATHHELEEAIESPLETPDERPVIDHYGEPVWELVKISTEDNGEPLVDIFAVCPDLRWAPESPRFDFPRSGLARQSVAEMLKRAQELLPELCRYRRDERRRRFETANPPATTPAPA